jgi:predicted CoA-binding protein
VPPLVEEAVEKGAKAVWMQEGIVNPEALQRAKEAGLRAVMDRCIYREGFCRSQRRSHYYKED